MQSLPVIPKAAGAVLGYQGDLWKPREAKSAFVRDVADGRAARMDRVAAGRLPPRQQVAQLGPIARAARDDFLWLRSLQNRPRLVPGVEGDESGNHRMLSG